MEGRARRKSRRLMYISPEYQLNEETNDHES